MVEVRPTTTVLCVAIHQRALFEGCGAALITAEKKSGMNLAGGFRRDPISGSNAFCYSIPRKGEGTFSASSFRGVEPPGYYHFVPLGLQSAEKIEGREGLLLALNPRIDLLFEHVERDHAGAEDDVVEFSDREFGAEGFFGFVAEFEDAELPDHVGAGLALHDDVPFAVLRRDAVIDLLLRVHFWRTRRPGSWFAQGIPSAFLAADFFHQSCFQ